MPTFYIGAAVRAKQRRAAEAHTSLQDAPPPPTGVGTELKRLLAWFGYKSRTRRDGTVKKCRCDERAAEMDALGIEWCEENRAVIIDWLREGAAELEVRFYEAAARGALEAAIWSAKRKAAGQC